MVEIFLADTVMYYFTRGMLCVTYTKVTKIKTKLVEVGTHLELKI